MVPLEGDNLVPKDGEVDVLIAAISISGLGRRTN
jgi:hypothetical protein